MPALGVFVITEDAFHRDIVRGASRYAFERGWRVRICQERIDGPAEALPGLIRRHAADAYVVQGVERPAVTQAFVATGRPVVAVTARLPGFAGPVVALDNRAIGRAAARHLLERGFRSFGFLGWRDATWAVARLTGFHDALADAGAHPATFFLNRATLSLVGASHDDWHEAAARWLRGLPRPLAVLAHNDAVAAEVARLCHERGIRVPEDVAVLGTSDDPFTCETAFPALSSVRLPGVALGLEAAQLAERLLAGEELAGVDLLLPPLGIALRRSTDIVAVDDPALAAAMRMLHERWREEPDLGGVAEAVGLSRRTLERRFRRHFGRSPQAEVRRLRLEKARHLLLETTREIARIAAECGFTDASAFGRAFRREMGESPGALRSRHAAGE